MLPTKPLFRPKPGRLHDTHLDHQMGHVHKNITRDYFSANNAIPNGHSTNEVLSGGRNSHKVAGMHPCSRELRAFLSAECTGKLATTDDNILAAIVLRDRFEDFEMEIGEAFMPRANDEHRSFCINWIYRRGRREYLHVQVA